MKTAFITGASSGIGPRHGRGAGQGRLSANCYWPAAAERLAELAQELAPTAGAPARPSTCATGRPWKPPWPGCRPSLPR
ncbi:MAG: hypothetical protein WKG07_47530 [Hymenobacter sp.]